MHLQDQRLNVVQSRGKFSTLSLATAPEMLAMEVTPGLQQEQSPTPIILCHDLFIDGVTEWKPTQNNIVLTLKLGRVCMNR
jgi:hypothetical protein